MQRNYTHIKWNTFSLESILTGQKSVATVTCACACKYVHHLEMYFVPASLNSMVVLLFRGLVALWQYMRNELGIETDPIWESVKDIVVKTIIW